MITRAGLRQPFLFAAVLCLLATALPVEALTFNLNYDAANSNPPPWRIPRAQT